MMNVSDYGGKVVLSIGEIIAGVLLFIDPIGFTGTIIKLVGALLTVSGLILAVQYFRTDPVEAHMGQGLAKALCALSVGLFCIFKTDWFQTTFSIITVVYGIVIFFTGIIRVQWAVDMLRLENKRWYIAGIGALFSLIFGGVILLNPFATTEILWKVIAVSMIVNAVLDLTAAAFLRSVIRDMSAGK